MIELYVFDTNCLISAYLKKDSLIRKALDRAMEIGLLVCSIETFNEFVDTFIRRKFDKYISIDTRLAIVKAIELKCQFFDITIEVTDCRDPKDNKFLSLALSSNASYIITGDKDLLVLNPYHQVKIITPAEFLSV